jgi:methylmalonyl-CoA/ethylmalonyl-CoA epimerase
MLHQIAQRVEDLDRAVAFYRDDVGLPLLGTFDPPGLAFFDLGGGTRMLLEAGAPSAILYLGVDDIEAARASLASKDVDLVDDIHRIHVHDGSLGSPAGTEEWMCFFRDSEGNLLGLSELRQPS